MATPGPGEDGEHLTFCRVCEAICGLVVTVENGRAVHVAPDRDHPVSQGHICVKGPGVLPIVYDQDRVLQPLKRVGGPGEFVAVTWDEALGDIVRRLQAIIGEHGGEALAAFFGTATSWGTLHGMYAARFVRALGGSKLYSPMHVDIAPKCVASETIFGHPMNHAFPDIERCDFLLMLGANPAVSKMSLINEPRALERLRAIAEREGVVVVDPRRTETAERFEYVPIAPDTDAWLLGAMLSEIFRQGWVDELRLDETVNGWRELRATAEFPLDEAAARTGVPAAVIVELAQRFAQARRAAVYGRCGVSRGAFSTPANLFIEALNVVTGRFGEPGGWILGRSQLASWFDAPPEPYGAKTSRTGSIPLIRGNEPGGNLPNDILNPGEGQIRALIIDGGNPMLSMPDGAKLETALETLDLLVGIDIYVTESNRHAHYILPATTFFERWDMNERWVKNMPRPLLQYTDAVIAPVGDVRHEYEIYEDLRSRLGLPTSFAGLLGEGGSPTLRDVADDLVRSGPLGDHYGARPEGLSIDKLRKAHPHGFVVSPNVDAAASWQSVLTPGGKPRLWNELFADEIARMKAHRPAPAQDELKLVGRRLLKSCNTWMHNNERLVRSDRPTLMIHPLDAAARRIADGGQVKVASKTSSVTMTAEVTDEIVQGAVSYPHGWGHGGGWRTANAKGGANVNLLVSSEPEDWEFVSGTPLLDGIPVTVEPVALGAPADAAPTTPA